MISVLYVDDEQQLLELGKLFLEHSGDFQVDLLDSAKASLEHLKTHHYDAIVSDYQMPGMNGIELLKAVREQFGEVPFILFTGRGREEVVIQAINNGADFYLQKGGDPRAQFAELAHKLRQAVRRRKAEIDRIRSEEKFSKLFMTNPSLESITDMATGTLIDVNEAWVRTTRYTREEAIGSSPGDLDLLVDAIDREEMESVLAKDGTLPSTEIRVRTKGGEIRVLDFSGQIIRIGDRVLFFSQAVDITERKIAEENLRKSEERYRDVVETQTEFISRFLPDGTHVFVNEAYCRYFGLKRPDILGHRFRPRVPPEDKERVDQFFASLTAENPSGSIEHRVIMPDGSIRWNRWSDLAIFDDAGQVFEYQSTGKDITEQKQFEEDLKRSENLYRATFDCTVASTSLIDPDTIVLKVNSSWEKMTGFTREEVENRLSWMQFIHKDDVERLKQYHYARRKDPASAPTIYECRVIDRNGGIHHCLAYVGVIQETRNSITSLVDITERKQAEEALQKSENLYRAIFEYTGAASIIIGPDTTILRANKGWERLTRVPRGEQENQVSWTFFFNKDDAERMKAYHYARRQDPGRVPGEYESHLIDSSGYIHNVIVHVGMIPGTANSVASLVDITERRKVEDDLRQKYGDLAAVEQQLRAQFDELKQSEQKIRESEKEYRNILENIQEVYYRTDTDGNLVLASPSLAVVLGYSPVSSLYGKNIATSLYVNPDDRKAFLDAVETQGPVVNYEILLKRQDRTPVTVIVSSHKYFSDDGRFLGIEGIFRDITDRRQAEDRLREREERLRVFMDSAMDAFSIWDADLNLVDINRAALSSLPAGTRKEDVIGKNLREFLPGPDEWEVCDRYREVLKTGVPFAITETSPKTLFHKQWVNVRSFKVGDGLGIISTDVPLQKETEEELRKSEELYRKLVANIPDIVIRTDLSGAILDINEKGLELGGYSSEEEVLGMSVFGFFTREDLPRALENSRLMFDRQLGPVQYTFVTRDGGRHTLEINGDVLRNPDSSLYGMVYVGRDITQRYIADAAIRNAHRQLTLMSGITRHDILNNITAIHGFLDMIRTRSGDPESVSCLQKIEEKIRQIQSQIEFTRIYEDLGSHEPVWQDIHDTFAKIPAPHGISMSDECAGIEVYADVMFEKVFGNLVDNSVHHGGAVSAIKLTARETEGRLLVYYEDDGAGIGADEREHIFERGFGKKTGLGLFLIREVLSLTGITITENGEPGMGARFILAVPKGAYRFDDATRNPDRG